MVSAAVALARARADELKLPSPSKSLLAALLASDFAFELLKREPAWAATLETPPHAPERGDALALVQFRQRRALSQIALECSGRMSVEASIAYASATAEQALEAALIQAEAELIPRFGSSLDSAGRPQRLIVFAMGKLGGGELNFSSDIDLITAFGESGDTHGARTLDNHEFFARITRRVAQLLSELTALGSAYRVDLRLRPFGTAGQATHSFNAMESYYQREGRDWERYAWIKARPVAGDLQRGAELCEMLRPFVYRRYLDYAAFEGLREMKALVDAQVRRQGMENNIKLGAGGIREIEFWVQLQQLIRGGRDPKLRVRSTLGALRALLDAGHISASQAGELSADYLFLRALENRLQMLRDQQTHALPEDAGDRLRIAVGLGFNEWSELLEKLASVRSRVRGHFAEAMQMPGTATNASDADDSAKILWQSLSGRQSDPPEKPAEMPAELWHALSNFADSAVVRAMSARGQLRLDRVVPSLWAAAQTQADSTSCALRLIEFLRAIAGRSAYLALLAERPSVGVRLAELFSNSAWLARLMTSTPILLDELLDARRLDAEVDRATLRAEAHSQLANLESADTEHAFEVLASLQHSVQMRVATQVLSGKQTAHRAAGALADLADELLSAVLDWAWNELATQHGLPNDQAAGFAVIAYGSLGGRELNFASDLDLVFLYDEALSSGETSGPKPMEHPRFFAKLAQRVLSLLTTATRFGALYPIDTRLRPNGNKGLLVTTLASYANYQHQEAWLWEHQALVRARFSGGDSALGARFTQLRAEVLGRPRDAQTVAREVSSMRERLRAERDRSTAQLYDLKQGKDGLVDIEFALQQAVLSASQIRDWPCDSQSLLAEFPPLQHLADRHEHLLAQAMHATLQLKPRVVSHVELK